VGFFKINYQGEKASSVVRIKIKKNKNNKIIKLDNLADHLTKSDVPEKKYKCGKNTDVKKHSYMIYQPYWYFSNTKYKCGEKNEYTNIRNESTTSASC
jgi:hypothetical protein